MTPKLLKQGEAAEILLVPVARMSRLRRSGIGPAYIRLGRDVRYDLDVLRQWLKDQSFTSTPEEREAAQQDLLSKA